MIRVYLKRGAQNSLSYIFSSIIVRGINFIILPFFLARLTLEEFGIWDFYQTFFSLSSMVLASCAATAMTRYYLLFQGHEVRQQQAVGNALLTTICAIGCFVVSILIYAYGMRIEPFSIYSVCTITNAILFAPFSLVLAYYRMREERIRYMLLFCGQALVATIATVAGVWYGYGVLAFFYANTLSCIIMVPLFMQLCTRYVSYSWSLLKEQLIYSAPLLLNGLLYTLFFTIDRYMIREYVGGYEALGLYGLLWRFGGIFQFCAIALNDAWVLALFNAHKEKNGDELIARLMHYVAMLLATGGITSMVVCRYAVGMMFPVAFHGIVTYLPLFFLGLALLEIGRLGCAGMNLARNTSVLPILSFITISMQAFLFFMLRSHGVLAICVGNCVAFFFYGFLSYIASIRVYSSAIFDGFKTVRLVSCLVLYGVVLQGLCLMYAPWYALALVLVSWPGALWVSGCITHDEKKWIGARVIKEIPYYAQVVSKQKERHESK